MNATLNWLRIAEENLQAHGDEADLAACREAIRCVEGYGPLLAAHQGLTAVFAELQRERDHRTDLPMPASSGVHIRPGVLCRLTPPRQAAADGRTDGLALAASDPAAGLAAAAFAELQRERDTLRATLERLHLAATACQHAQEADGRCSACLEAAWDEVFLESEPSEPSASLLTKEKGLPGPADLGEPECELDQFRPAPPPAEWDALRAALTAKDVALDEAIAKIEEWLDPEHYGDTVARLRAARNKAAAPLATPSAEGGGESPAGSLPPLSVTSTPFRKLIHEVCWLLAACAAKDTAIDEFLKLWENDRYRVVPDSYLVGLRMARAAEESK